MGQFILTIDAGTTGIQVSFFDLETLEMYGNNKIEFQQIYPRPGLVEHNPDDFWHCTLKAYDIAVYLTKEVRPHFSEKDIVCVGITNQRETCLAWNRLTGELAGNALVWQDRRTAEFCESLKHNDKHSKLIQARTGLICDPYFSASKMRWMLEHYPKAKIWVEKNELAFGTVDSYLVWKLTGGDAFCTDLTNASRTLLFNIHTKAYDNELIDLFQVPPSALPEVKYSSGVFGVVKNIPNIPSGIPITGILGDQQAALFGHRCCQLGQGKITFGTGAFLLVHTGEVPATSQEGLLTTISYGISGRTMYALEGSAFIAGAAVHFLRDNFGWVKNSSESAQIAMHYPRDEDLFFVPSLAGLGAPYWNPNAKGVLFGLTRGTQKSQIIRAVLESIALQNVQLLKLMEKAINQKITYIGVDGGASRNDYLMQFQSDMLQVRLVRPKNTETTSLGVAYAAKIGLLGVDEYEKLIEMNSNEAQGQEFIPQIPLALAQANLYKWERAVSFVDAFYQQ